MKEIGVGIVGYGFIGKVHTYSYVNIPFYYDDLSFKINLVGVCDVNQSSLEKARNEGGFTVCTSDYHDLLRRDDIQVINCCTPNVYHKQLILDAAKAGKHVYCDKPLAINLEDAKEMTQVVECSGIMNQVTLEYRFFPALMRAKQLVTEGFLGKVFNFRVLYLHSGYIDPNRPLSWRTNKQVGGGGALLDMGPHPIDVARYLLGDFSKVLATTRTFIKERPSMEDGSKLVKVEVDDLATMQVEMESGAIGYIEASRLSTGMNDELRIEIHGSMGAIAFNSMDPNWLSVYDCRDKDEPIGGNRGFKKIETVQRYPKPCNFPGPKFTTGWIRSHVASLYDFIVHVAEDTATEITFRDGLKIQEVIEAAYLSAQTSYWTDVR